MQQKISMVHLYPDDMNLYGDGGNVIAYQRRCEWRGIDFQVRNVNVGDAVDFSDVDIIFMGGGQDSGQKIVAEDLLEKGEDIKNEVDKGLPALLICGGFQLFGNYFETADAVRIPGIGIFDAYTIAGEKRFSGNMVVDITPVALEWEGRFGLNRDTSRQVTLVGFENHSGQTFLKGNTKPLGRVVCGYGNKGDSGHEGAVYKNAIGTYLHGSVLPKNPYLADHLILAALCRRYGKVKPLSCINDTIEMAAHQAAEKRCERIKTLSI